jgi:hypothetical protein
VGEHQWEWSGTPHLCQHGAGDLLSVTVPRHGSRVWTMRGGTLVDPQGTQVVCQIGFLLGCHGKDVMGKFSR